MAKGRIEKHKIKEIILDRLILGLVLAIVGFVFNIFLQNHLSRRDYQKIIFETRIESYEKIISQSKLIRDHIAMFLLLGDIPKDIKIIGSEIKWRMELIDLRKYVVTGDKRSIVDYKKELDIITKGLEDLQEIRENSSLYISKDIDIMIDNFLNVVLEAIKESVPEKIYNDEAWSNVKEAYDSLHQELRKKLGIEEIILG